MKKLSIIFTAVAVFSFSSLNLSAQDYKSTVSIDAGASLVGTLLKAITFTDGSTPDDYSYTSIPVVQVTYDYMITDRLSAGVAGAYQQFSFKDPVGDIAVQRTNFISDFPSF